MPLDKKFLKIILIVTINPFKTTMTKKVICVWTGSFDSEEQFYNDYLCVNYDNEDAPTSLFGKDTKIDYYDEDFIESWWFKQLDLDVLNEYKNDLLDAEYFFDDLIEQLKTLDLTKWNTITFLFGEIGTYPTNEFLFNYESPSTKDVPIDFVFKKEYQLN